MLADNAAVLPLRMLAATLLRMLSANPSFLFESTVHHLKWNIDPMALMQHLLERTPNVIAQVSASLPPGFDESVAQTIFGQLIKLTEKLSDGCERLS